MCVLSDHPVVRAYMLDTVSYPRLISTFGLWRGGNTGSYIASLWPIWCLVSLFLLFLCLFATIQEVTQMMVRIANEECRGEEQRRQEHLARHGHLLHNKMAPVRLDGAGEYCRFQNMFYTIGLNIKNILRRV